MPRCRTLRSLALLVVLATGCRLGVSAEADVARDGSGTAALVVTLDQALLAELDELQVDPTAELSAAAATVPDWQLRRQVTTDDTLVLTLRREVATPQELADAFRELTAGLTPTDPALAVDLDLDVDPDGAATLAGTVQLRTPVGPGVVTDEVTEADVAELASSAVDAALVVSLPGQVVSSDADVVDGTTVTWTVEPGPPRAISAEAAAPTTWSAERIAGLVAASLLLLSVTLLGTVWWRRRSAATT